MAAQTFGNYINGEWITSGRATFENRNPANTDEIVGLFVKGTAADVEAAAEAAHAAFAGWSTMAGPARGALLYKVADILDRKFDSIAADIPAKKAKRCLKRRVRSAGPSISSGISRARAPVCLA